MIVNIFNSKSRGICGDQIAEEESMLGNVMMSVLSDRRCSASVICADPFGEPRSGSYVSLDLV